MEKRKGIVGWFARLFGAIIAATIIFETILNIFICFSFLAGGFFIIIAQV